MPKKMKDLLATATPTNLSEQKTIDREQQLREALAAVSPEALALLDSTKISVSEAASHSLARVHQHSKDREIGFITAHRGEHSAEKNNHLNSELAHDIRKAGYGHIPIRGQYIENKGTPHERKVTERSFMVIGNHKGKHTGLKKFLTKHGEKYGQESIVHKAHDSENAHLHMTGGPDKGQAHDIGKFHANKTSEYHSAMKGGKKSFTFTNESHFYLMEKSFSTRRERLID
jgi:hypothetical protein